MKDYTQRESSDHQKRPYLSASLSRYVSRFTGSHLGNWSNIQDIANQISHITDINHNAYAFGTGFVIR